MSDLLSIRNLTVAVNEQKILNEVDLNIGRGRIVGVVGESGSGKTSLGLSILRLLPQAMTIKSGHILFDQDDLLQLPDEQMRPVRGAEIGMVFQEPLLAFDPLFTIGAHIEEVLTTHTLDNKTLRRQKIEEALQLVQLKDPKRIFRSYPHQLSGGERQRAMIAQAMICSPALLIADEPTSSLDVMVAAEIMQLLKDLSRQKGMALLLISHDLGAVAQTVDEIVVMKQGIVVEAGKPAEILRRPKHEYTRQLIEAY